MSQINRRSFLRRLFGVATAAAAPTYFFAPIGGWKSDTIINPNDWRPSAYHTMVDGPITYTTYLLASDCILLDNGKGLKEEVERLRKLHPGESWMASRMPYNAIADPAYLVESSITFKKVNT